MIGRHATMEPCGAMRIMFRYGSPSLVSVVSMCDCHNRLVEIPMFSCCQDAFDIYFSFLFL